MWLLFIAYVCREQKMTLGVIFQVASTSFYRDGVSHWTKPYQFSWALISRELPVSASLVLGLQLLPLCLELFFYTSLGDQTQALCLYAL